MPRTSSRSRRKPQRFGYSASGEPYPQGSRLAATRALRQPGRRVVPEEPIVIEKPPEKGKLSFRPLMQKVLKFANVGPLQ